MTKQIQMRKLENIKESIKQLPQEDQLDMRLGIVNSIARLTMKEYQVQKLRKLCTT